MSTRAELVNRAEQIGPLAERLARAQTLAVDLESNGLFAFTARLCTLQILELDTENPVVVVDPLELPDSALAPLGPVLGASGPRKLVHDVSFDARILAQHGLALRNVFDTALAARFLGAPGTGLATLAEARLGLKLSKKMQHHDWGRRPFPPEALEYLASDVAVLPPIAAQLQVEIAAKDLGAELEEETNYRLAGAWSDAATPDPRPPYVRIRDADKLKPAALAILRELAGVRDGEAKRLDVPPFKVFDNAVLIALANQPPKAKAELASMRGLQHGRARALHDALWTALERGLAAKEIPHGEREAFFTAPPKPPRAELTAARQREQRLMAWRKAEAARRGVDDQAVLPGHVLHRLAAHAPMTREALAQVAGLGAFRVARDGEAILKAIAGG